MTYKDKNQFGGLLLKLCKSITFSIQTFLSEKVYIISLHIALMIHGGISIKVWRLVKNVTSLVNVVCL